MADPVVTDLSTLPPLARARVCLIGAMANLVGVARSLPEDSLERHALRHTLADLANALVRIHPPSEGAVAMAYALQQLEILNHAPMVGATVEGCADVLARWFLDHGDV